MIAAIAIAFLAVAGATTRHTAHISAPCGMRVTLPKGWVIHSAASNADQCRFYAAPKNWTRIKKESDIHLPDFPVTFTVTNEPFEQAATDAGFMTVAELRRRERDPSECPELAPDTWLIMGGRGSRSCHEASEVHSLRFTGIAAFSSYGRLKKHTGYYAGLGEFCAAVVRQGSAAVIIQGTEVNFEETFVPIVESLTPEK